MSLPRSSFFRLFASLAVGAVLLAGCSPSEPEVTDADGNPVTEQSQDSNNPAGNTETASGGADGGETGNGSSDGNEGAEGESEPVLPPKSEFTEDIELAKSMTAEEVEQYNEDLMAQLNEEYNKATEDEHQTMLRELDELDDEFLPEYEALEADEDQAFQDLGDSASQEDFDAYVVEFSDRKRELDGEFERRQQEIHDRFMEATEPTRLEFEPRFIEQHARYVYMLEVAEDS